MTQDPQVASGEAAIEWSIGDTVSVPDGGVGYVHALLTDDLFNNDVSVKMLDNDSIRRFKSEELIRVTDLPDISLIEEEGDPGYFPEFTYQVGDRVIYTSVITEASFPAVVTHVFPIDEEQPELGERFEISPEHTNSRFTTTVENLVPAPEVVEEEVPFDEALDTIPEEPSEDAQEFLDNQWLNDYSAEDEELYGAEEDFFDSLYAEEPCVVKIDLRAPGVKWASVHIESADYNQVVNLAVSTLLAYNPPSGEASADQGPE